ncbi:MAG: hypothetical protein HYS04_11895 [Acidobacteria bacterium]|nr:hypothetical protein [Acidobacteriota bacterium]
MTMPDSSADARLTVAVTRYDFLILSPFLSRTGTARMRTLVASAPVEDPI